MMKAFTRIAMALLTVTALSLCTARANYIRVTNVSFNMTNKTITFDVAWNNSWRIDGSMAPFNWDAAWIFAKWRACGASAATQWTHGRVDPASPLNSFGTLSPHAEGYPSGYYPDSGGVMLRRSAVGLYPAAGFTTVTVRFANFPASGDYDVRVFGIEMVYVPQGEYLIGNSGTENQRFENASSLPYLISSEAAATVTSSAWAPNNSVNLGAAYPKGFKAFYIMKYEISQDQYCQFLNTVPATVGAARFPGSFSFSRNRTNSGGTPPDLYYSDRGDRAQNYMNWADLAAYLDWAALRPNTEMEYEKACRGIGAANPDEYAWGTTTIVQALALTSPENGTEVVTTANANCNYSFPFFTGGDGGSGPLRVGIFATAGTSTRQQTGATYYGIMEMSGNLWEQFVNVSNQTCAACAYPFNGVVGDGYLNNVTGTANAATWPPNTGTINGRAFRGGGYSSFFSELCVSDRGQAFNTTDSRSDSYGGRGGR